MQICLIFFLFLSISCEGVFFSKNNDRYQENTHHLPYTLNEKFRFSNKYVSFFPLDLENDGTDELLTLVKEEEIQYSIRFYREYFQQVLNQFNYPIEELAFDDRSFAVFFKTPEGDSRICVSAKANNESYLYVFNEKLYLTARISIVSGHDRDGNGFWDGEAYIVAVKDLDGDEYPEIIMRVSSNYDLIPRGIWVVSIKQRTVMWTFPTGTEVTDIVVEDLENDGDLEIVFGGSAVNNGANANGTDDRHSYLIVLDHTGKLVWRLETGGEFSGCFPGVADLHRDGNKEIITMYRSRGPDAPVSGSIRIRDPKTGSIEREYSALLRPSKTLISDIDLDGRDEIIVGTVSVEPELLVLTDSLSLKKRIPLPYGAGDILIEDLNRDREKEIIVTKETLGKTLVMDSRFRKIAEASAGGILVPVQQGLGKSKLLAVHSRKDGTVFFELNKSEWISRIPVDYLILGFFIGALVLSAIFLLIKWLSLGFVDSIRVEQLLNRFSTGVLWLDRKEKIRFCNPAAASLLCLQASVSVRRVAPDSHVLQTLRKIAAESRHSPKPGSRDGVEKKVVMDSKEISVIVMPYLRKYRSNGVVYLFEDLTEKSRSRRALLWSGLAQKLAHEIKNPLATVLLTIQRLQISYQEDGVKNADQYDKYTQSALEEIERLRRVTDGFMKFTRIKEPDMNTEPVESVVKKIELRVREWLPEGVSLNVGVEQGLPDIRVDMDQMQTMFFNLFDNAVKAMKGKGRLSLRVNLMEWIEKGDECGNHPNVLFELTDTGCGIPVEQIDDLFEPYVSLREGGTGLGLNICKQIVEDHKGKIGITSRVDIGTTVTVEIPAIHHE